MHGVEKNNNNNNDNDDDNNNNNNLWKLWKLFQKLGLDHGDRWYNHKVESVIVTEDIRLLLDFPIQTDHRLEHNRPDIVFENKKDRSCLLIDISFPSIPGLKEKKRKKFEV